MKRTLKKDNFKCHYRHFDGMIMSFDALDVIEIPEIHEGKFSVNSVICPVFITNLNDTVKRPRSVGISSDILQNIENSLNFIEIFHRRNVTRENKSIAVCPGPVFSTYDNALRIAEYIEIYKLQGASKFYFYDAGISQNVMKLLKFYESQGTVEILTWNIATYVEINQAMIHHYGIIGCLNECFYHATLIDDFEYFIHADFDEEIFSYKTDTLKEFLEINDKAEIHSFVFSNYFFFFEFGHDLTNIPSNATNKFLYTQAQVTKMNKTMGSDVRTKYIAKRDSVELIGNHFVWKAASNSRKIEVKPTEGAVHHYRDDCPLFKLCDEPTVNDTYARKFGLELWKNVDENCAKVFENGKCPFGRNFTLLNFQ
jgi:Glycosyltransferase family 92